VTTSGSIFTRYTPQTAGSRGTRASSKTRRREERKRARGKKGTIYEEEYLVNSIGRLIQRVQDVRDDVTRLITALMTIDKRFEAKELQKNFQKLVEEISGCISEVFSEPLLTNRISRDGVEEISVARGVPIMESFRGSELILI
jgi:elongator complex protein 1